ncbi:MAG: hypothetical protein U0M42_05425 [Acutalibacteraceae bacterium]|nr:hypothetical protein [Acutalibacteraceae bacterium]
MNDILLKANDNVFGLRTAGICLNKERVLLCKTNHNGGYALPGCYVNFSKTSEEALEEYLNKELNADVIVDDLKWIGESLYLREKYPCHEICFYYTFTIISSNPIKTVGSVQNGITYKWLPLSSINSVKTFPENLKELIDNLHSDKLVHFVDRQIKKQVL